MLKQCMLILISSILMFSNLNLMMLSTVDGTNENITTEEEYNPRFYEFIEEELNQEKEEYRGELEVQDDYPLIEKEIEKEDGQNQEEPFEEATENEDREDYFINHGRSSNIPIQ